MRRDEAGRVLLFGWSLRGPLASSSISLTHHTPWACPATEAAQEAKDKEQSHWESAKKHGDAACAETAEETQRRLAMVRAGPGGGRG